MTRYLCSRRKRIWPEAGELMPFLDERQVSVLEDPTWDQDCFSTRQMSAAFEALRSNELV